MIRAEIERFADKPLPHHAVCVTNRMCVMVNILVIAVQCGQASCMSKLMKDNFVNSSPRAIQTAVPSQNYRRKNERDCYTLSDKASCGCDSIQTCTPESNVLNSKKETCLAGIDARCIDIVCLIKTRNIVVHGIIELCRRFKVRMLELGALILVKS